MVDFYELSVCGRCSGHVMISIYKLKFRLLEIDDN